MSTPNEKDQVTAGGEQEMVSNWRFLIPVIAFGVSFVIFLGIGWIAFPKFLYSEKEQPLDFNHQLHVDEMGDCEACHYFRDDGSYAGIPTIDNCIMCHEFPMGEDPEELKLVDEYITPGKEIPWLVYSRQPDCVFFSHAAHVRMAGMDCMTCHGPIGESEHSKPYQYNILTCYSRDIWGHSIAGFKKNPWDSMKMDDCAECHEENGVSQGCFVCHK